MRFVLTAVIWIVIVGGLWGYTRQRLQAEAGIERIQPQLVQVTQKFDLILTPTFSVEPDPFALQVTDELAVTMDLRINGQQVAIAADSLQRGVPLVIEDVRGLVEGQNEIYVQASPPLSESEKSHAVRVQLRRASSSLMDNTIWASQGARVLGTVNFVLTARGDSGTGEADEH
ncbi:hypothetical protein [Desulfosediminicola ganghwensis]|uniref:hypothetical protein n=1 Tax=Desulfosediminicola ganghwensis TaxID=2569540 RepID=UPI0010AD628A|nr:hypothetical protein [Desulfosediminicola ganghwensis]